MSCTNSTYCLSNTGNVNINDNYVSGGTFNNKSFYTGVTNGNFIYFDTGNTQWCLSVSLGGTCLMSGDSPKTSNCPDLSSLYFTTGLCPTPTPTPTSGVDCTTLDFTAFFDCEYTPTPTITSTPTPTPTPTITPTSTDICGGVGVDASISSVTPTPSVTPTITPSPSPEITRPCVYSGDVTFNTISGNIICPYSYEFQDCYSGELYLTTNPPINPSSGEIEEFMVFKSTVNGITKCISFIRINVDSIGVDTIELIEGPFGYSNMGDCILCVPTPTPTPTSTVTPTPSITPTVTPTSEITPTPTTTPTLTPSSTPEIEYYVYSMCGNVNSWLVQDVQSTTSTSGEVQKDNDESCWKFEFVSQGYPNLSPSLNIVDNLGSDYFNGSQVYSDCDECSFVEVDDKTEINIFFDNSGSMNSTLDPLNDMRDNLLKNCLLPFYDNDGALYDERVNVFLMGAYTVNGVTSGERGFRVLSQEGSNSTITKVINLVFQDESSPYYTGSVSSWSINTSRTTRFNSDISLLRSVINNQPTPDYIRGVFFRVIRSGDPQSDDLRELLVAVRDGDGQYTGNYGLSDKNEIGFELDVDQGKTAQYYADLIVQSLNNLGYNLPSC